MRLLVAAICSVALLAGCGSDAETLPSSQSTTPPTATTSTAGPVSTSTTTPATTAVPPTSDTVAVTDAPSSAPDTTVEDTEAPDTSAAPTTEDTTAPSDAPTSAPQVAADYSPVDPPTVPEVSASVPADGTLPDGVYYATVTEGGDPPPATGEVVFELVQLLRGEACTQHFAEEEDACVNDYGVETDPTATLSVPLTGDMFISVADAATQQSLEITGTELYGLIHGDEPSANAPEDYTYVGFGYFLTIADGQVTRLEQWWTP